MSAVRVLSVIVAAAGATSRFVSDTRTQVQNRKIFISKVENLQAQLKAIDTKLAEARSRMNHWTQAEQTAYMSKREPPTPRSLFPPDKGTLMIKLVFTAIFAGAALYVVLSKRYAEGTGKWAFSVLTTISGYWLGTATV
jgi:hypothetical protein